MSQDGYVYSCTLNFKNHTTESLLLQNSIKCMQNIDKKDLQRILELFAATRDIQTQVKILSILSVYLVSNRKHSEVIIKFKPIYDKIHAILLRGLPQKTTMSLNFLTVLLYIDEEKNFTKRNALIVYAQSMIRESGCLTAMSKLFLNCMMPHDTWRALCRCLAEACRGMDLNQNYCSHLIPLCMKRCLQGNTDVFLVLQCFLSNNSRNVQLFMDCDGYTVFTRDFLKYDVCLQLLNTIIITSAPFRSLIHKTNILQDLREFNQIYGPNTQLSLWATIILYNAESNIRVMKNVKKQNTPSELSENALTFNKIHDNSGDTQDTIDLLKNVKKELLYYKPNRATSISNIREFHTNSNKIQIDHQKNRRRYKYQNDNLTFSNSYKNSFSGIKPRNNNNSAENRFKVNNQLASYTAKIKTNVPTDTCTQLNESDTYENEESEINFSPTISSTPNKYHQKNITSPTRSSVGKGNRAVCKLSQVSSVNKTVLSKKKSLNKGQVKHRTIGARLFNAINESCTTLVRSVKNVFTQKNNGETSCKVPENNKTNTGNEDSCSYSFMNYMRKRDAFVNQEISNCTLYDISKIESNYTNFCNTCNDTISLKRKLADNDDLKRTVKKLKLGINFYGCDFKKISRKMWPHENFMTPQVLYNLYRKLIVK